MLKESLPHRLVGWLEMVEQVPRQASSVARSAPVPEKPPRRRWVFLMLTAAGVVSAVASLLSLAAGNNVPTAILTVGAAFAGATGLLLGIAHYAAE